jgi:hypothetical protein
VRLPVEIDAAIDRLTLSLDMSYRFEGSLMFRVLPADAQKRAQDAREALEAAILRFTDAGASEATEDAAIRALLDDDEGDW